MSAHERTASEIALAEIARVAQRMKNTQPLSEGRIVHVVLPNPDPHTGEPISRPAIVVRAWNDNCANVQIFYDGSNDDEARRGWVRQPGDDLTAWLPSVTYDAGEPRRITDRSKAGFVSEKTITHYNPYTWHWPPRAK